MMVTGGAIAARIEQGLGELQRPEDRGARRAPVGRALDLVRHRRSRFRTVDQPPWQDDLLVVHAGPFEARNRYPAMAAVAQRLQEFA
jgi:hypothetical protein